MNRVKPKPKHRFEARIYYEDTDFSGAVYHAAYLKFMERARTEMLRAHGIHHTALLDEGVTFAVSRMDIRYLAPAHIDDLLQIETETVSVGGARMVLGQTVARGEQVLVRAEVEVVALNRAGRPIRLPAVLRATFAPGAAQANS